MSIRASWPFANATVEGLAGPTLDCVRAGVSHAVYAHIERLGRYRPNTPRFSRCRYLHNFLTNSNDLSHADWTKVNCTVALSETVLDPFGDPAWVVTDDGTAGSHGFHQTGFEVLSPSDANLRANRVVYVKEGTARYVTLGGTNVGTSTSTDLTLDLRTGDISDGCEYYQWSGGGDFHFIKDEGDGWFSIDYRDILSSAGIKFFSVFINPDGVTANGSYAGTGD